MFNIGGGEIAVILVVALLVLGPQRLPEMARALGKFMREFRRQTDEVRSTLESEFYKMDQPLNLELPKNAPRPIAQDDAERAKLLAALAGPFDGGRRPADELGLKPAEPPPASEAAPAAGAPEPSSADPVPPVPELPAEVRVAQLAQPLPVPEAEPVSVPAPGPSKDGSP